MHQFSNRVADVTLAELRRGLVKTTGGTDLETFEVAITTDSGGTNVIASARISNDFSNTGGCDAHKYSFDFIDVTLTGGTTYYVRTKVIANAPVRAWAGAMLYYDGGIPSYDRAYVNVANGQLYWNNGDFITTAFSIASGGTARYMVMGCLDDNSTGGTGLDHRERFRTRRQPLL